MELYVVSAVLTMMICVLAGMIAYVYWQQTRMLHHLQSMALALATHVQSTTPEEPVVEEKEPEEPEEEKSDEDDRVSVHEKVENVTGPPTDVDDLQDKTSAQLRELLTKKGIPYGKRDSKTVLIQLLKASS